MAMAGSYGVTIPPPGSATQVAIRRLSKDYMKLIEDPVDGITAMPNEENILEWNYCLRGSPGTNFAGGFYWGKVIFKENFPWSPPAIVMITPNGRFATNCRLCLSISDYHPESWNPGWTVSAILIGLHSFMNDTTPAAGAIRCTPDEQKQFALASKSYNSRCNEFRKIFPALVEEWTGTRPVPGEEPLPPPEPAIRPSTHDDPFNLPQMMNNVFGQGGIPMHPPGYPYLNRLPIGADPMPPRMPVAPMLRFNEARPFQQNGGYYNNAPLPYAVQNPNPYPYAVPPQNNYAAEPQQPRMADINTGNVYQPQAAAAPAVAPPAAAPANPVGRPRRVAAVRGNNAAPVAPAAPANDTNNDATGNEGEPQRKRVRTTRQGKANEIVK